MTDDYKKFLHTAPKEHLASLLGISANALDSPTGKIDFNKIHYILTCPEIKNRPSLNDLASFPGNICYSASVEQIKFLMTSPEVLAPLVMENNHGLIGACSSDNVEVVKYIVENLPEIDLYQLAHNKKNILLYMCILSQSVKTIEYLCFEYISDNKMLKSLVELGKYNNDIYLHVLKNTKFPKHLFNFDDLFKSVINANAFEHLIEQYNCDLTQKDIPQLFEHACSTDGDCILYLLNRKDIQHKYDINMKDDIIFKKLMDMENMEMIEELIFNRRLQLTPTIQDNMDEVVESIFKARDICDMKDKLEFDLPETKKIASRKI